MPVTCSRSDCSRMSRCCCTSSRAGSASSASAAASRWRARCATRSNAPTSSRSRARSSRPRRISRRRIAERCRTPRTRLVIGDGRTHVALGREPYDVLISEPSNPWIAGVAALFTREFFEAARRAAGARRADVPVGAHVRHLRRRPALDRRDVLVGVSRTRPSGSSATATSCSLGSAEPIEPRLTGRRPQLVARRRCRRSGGGRCRPARTFCCRSPSAGPRRSRGTRLAPTIQRDDRLQLEFSGPRGLYEKASSGTGAILRRAVSEPSGPPTVGRRTTGPRRRRRAGRCWCAPRRTMTPSASSPARSVTIRAATPRPVVSSDRRRRPAGSTRPSAMLRAIRRSDPGSVEVAIALSQLHASRGDFVLAVEPLQSRSPRATALTSARLEQLASVAADAADAAGARRRWSAASKPRRRAVPLRSTTRPPSTRSGAGWTSRCDPAEALSRTRWVPRPLPEPARRAVRRRRPQARGSTRLPRRDRRRSARRDRLHEPREIRNDAGNTAAARSLFAEALVLDPSSPPPGRGWRRRSGSAGCWVQGAELGCWVPGASAGAGC